MPITGADIEKLTFSEAKKGGYVTEEVDNFLDQIAPEVDAMLQKIADLKGRLNSSEQQLASAQAQIAQLKEQLAENASEHVSAPAPAPTPASGTPAATEHQISQVLIVAQQSADKLVAEARDNAETIRNEADQKAREVIRQALAEKQNELDEIDRLKQSREDFRTEYKKLLQHFMDDADSVFPEKALSSTPNGSKGTTASSQPYAAPAATPAPAAPAADANATVYQAPAAKPASSAPQGGFDDLD